MKTIRYSELTPEVIASLGEPCYWGAPDSERYETSDPDEAIADIIDCCDYTENYLPDGGEIDIEAVTPVPLVVKGRDLLEQLLETLDDEYGDPDGGGTEPTEGMVKAADALAAVIEREYSSWRCETRLRVVVNVAAWIKRNQ